MCGTFGMQHSTVQHIAVINKMSSAMFDVLGCNIFSSKRKQVTCVKCIAGCAIFAPANDLGGEAHSLDAAYIVPSKTKQIANDVVSQ